MMCTPYVSLTPANTYGVMCGKPYAKELRRIGQQLIEKIKGHNAPGGSGVLDIV